LNIRNGSPWSLAKASEDIWGKIERGNLYWKMLESVDKGGSIIHGYEMDGQNRI